MVISAARTDRTSVRRSGWSGRCRALPVLLLLIAGGCSQRGDVCYVGDAELTHYRDKATQIDYPHVHTLPNDTALMTDEPRRIRHPRQDELWDMPLMEAIHLALANNKIIRDADRGFAGGAARLPGQVSVFEPALQESGVLFGNRGVEAALADFDAQFTTSMLWGRNELVQNNRFLSGGLAPVSTLVEDSGIFASRLQKTFAYGGQFAVQHDWNYTSNNSPGRLFPSVYQGLLRAEYRQPLLAGAGLDYNRIAGPIGDNLFGVSGVSQGVVIARINTDISIADFEASVRNMLKDVEDLYWELALAYRVYDAEVVSRDSALQTWRSVEARRGLPGAGAAEEAQARDQYFENRARAEDALANLYSAEGQLRRLIGLPVNDGLVIRPIDEPSMAEYIADWHMSLAEGLTRRVELRRQKWAIKSLELQLQAAESLVRPRLDFVSNYRVNAFGDKLISQKDGDGGLSAQGLHSAYETFTQNNQTGWNLGFELSMPIGFRSAQAQVRNLELQMARARSVLAAQELDISHELSQAFQDIDRWYQTAETNFNRRRAAEKRVAAYQQQFQRGEIPVDLLLRSQISLAQAEIAYYRSLSEYNKAINALHFRKGTLLERNNVVLAEDLWHPDAYEDALEKAWARSHAFANDDLETEPVEFVQRRRVIPASAARMVPPDGVAVPLSPSFPPAPGPEGPEVPPPAPLPDGGEAGSDAAPSPPLDTISTEELPFFSPEEGPFGPQNDTLQRITPLTTEPGKQAVSGPTADAGLSFEELPFRPASHETPKPDPNRSPFEGAGPAWQSALSGNESPARPPTGPAMQKAAVPPRVDAPVATEPVAIEPAPKKPVIPADTPIAPAPPMGFLP